MAAVTVMVPTFEREDLISDAINSALAQSFDDLVVLVGDNSHTDATENLVRAIGDRRIRYHRNRPGLGAQGNWLDLVARAETPLVASLHDDDVWHPDFLAHTVPPMLADPSIGMTFTDFWLIDSAGERLDELTERESARTRRNALPDGTYRYDLAQGLRLVAVWNAPQPAYAAVLRREMIMGVDFPADTDPLYDIWLSYQMVKRGAGLRYVPQRLTNYRVHPGAVTSGGIARAEDAVFRRILDENPGLGPVSDEIGAYWADLRWARGTRLMTPGLQRRSDSQAELRGAAPALHGTKRAMAWTAARLSPVWYGLQMSRSVKHKLIDTHDPRHSDRRAGTQITAVGSR